MIVRYTRERGYKGLGTDPILTVGCDYIVLGILFRPCPDTSQVCILTNKDIGDHSDGMPFSDGGPGVFDMNLFDVVDPRVPLEWLFVDVGNGYYRLEPDEFAGDFWNRYNDADQGAETTFERIVGKLDAFHAAFPHTELR